VQDFYIAKYVILADEVHVNTCESHTSLTRR